MSILSDRTIESLCVMPEQILNEEEYYRLKETTVFPDVYYPNPLHGMEARRQFDDHLRQQASRPPTQAEIDAFQPMIAPFESRQVREVETPAGSRRVISYGTSSYGYDARLAREVKIFTNTNAMIINPKRMSDRADRCLVTAHILTDKDGAEYFILPPNSYALGYTIEHFHMPRDITSVVLGKSTYARAGLQVNATPIEAGFQGTVVLELANSTSLPMSVYINEGIAQFLFFRGDQPCLTSYADRGGKYQNQRGLELSKV